MVAISADIKRSPVNFEDWHHQRAVVNRVLRGLIGMEDIPPEFSIPVKEEGAFNQIMEHLTRASVLLEIEGNNATRQFRSPLLPRITVIRFQDGATHILSETREEEPIYHAVFSVSNEGFLTELIEMPAQRSMEDIKEENRAAGFESTHTFVFAPTPELVKLAPSGRIVLFRRRYG